MPLPWIVWLGGAVVATAVGYGIKKLLEDDYGIIYLDGLATAGKTTLKMVFNDKFDKEDLSKKEYESTLKLKKEGSIGKYKVWDTSGGDYKNPKTKEYLKNVKLDKKFKKLFLLVFRCDYYLSKKDKDDMLDIEQTKEKFDELIKQRKDMCAKYGWEFMFLGTHRDIIGDDEAEKLKKELREEFRVECEVFNLLKEPKDELRQEILGFLPKAKDKK